MGYYANAALERSYQERSCCGYPSREETLTYYLEDLQAMLSPYRDEYFENHFVISLEKLSLMLPPDFIEKSKSYN